MSAAASATTGRISLIGLSTRGHHDVLPLEREEDQLFMVDVILDLRQHGIAVAAVIDSVADAVDYSRVADGIMSIIEGGPVSLIESLADRIAEQVLSFPRIMAAEVTVYKPEAPLGVTFEDVLVTIHRVADAAVGHGGALATSQAAWVTQAGAPMAISTQPYASPSSSASPVAATSPAALAYELPAALAAPTTPIVSEVPDFSGASFTGGNAAPTTLASEAPITPTPSPASPMEAPARSPFVTTALSVPTSIPTESSTSGGNTELIQSWMPDWTTESAGSSTSSAPAWTPEVPEAPEATSLPSGEFTVSYFTSSVLDAPSTNAPTTTSAGRTAGTDGFVSLAAEALGTVPASSKPEPSALSYAEEVAADAAAATSSEPAPATDGLAIQLPHEGHHVTSFEEDEDQSVLTVKGFADLLGGPVAFDESGSYSGTTSSQIGEDEDATPETAGADASGFAFPALGGNTTASGTADADDLIEASSVPVSQSLGEPRPSPLAVPGELPEAAGQEGVALVSSEPFYSQPSVSGDFSQPAEGSYAMPSTQPDFLGAPDIAPVPTIPETPATPAAPVDPLSERPTRPVDVVFGLGADVGGVVDSLRMAVQSLKATEGIEVTQVAPLARTVAVAAGSAEPQPDYLNTVVTAMTTLAPRELLEVCQTLEITAGCVRIEPWGMRTLGVDLAEVEGVTPSDPTLSLPRPRAAERAFILVPWSRANPFARPAGRSVSELTGNVPGRGGLRWLAFDQLSSESLPDKPIGPYVEPPVEQDAASSEPGLVYDAIRDEPSVTDASLATDHAGSIIKASSAALGPAPAQPLGDQGQAESSSFKQLPFDTSNGADSWAGQAPQVDSPYRVASAPEAAGPQSSYTPGLSAGSDGVSHGQQDETAEDAWKSPLQQNDVIGGGTQGTGPHQDV